MYCHLKLGHHGSGMYWMTRGLDKEENAPQCYFDLNSVSFTTHDTNIQADPRAIISHLAPQCPQDYGEGFLFDYTENGKNGGNVFNIKRELSLSYVLVIISTNRLTVGLLKKRWMYCHTQFAGGNSTLVFGEDSLVTK